MWFGAADFGGEHHHRRRNVDESEINSIATEVVELIRQRLSAKGFELDSDMTADVLEDVQYAIERVLFD
jgi:hypothetical protein